MATFDACITEAADAGEISPESAELAQEAYAEALDANAHLGPDEADRVAAAASLQALEAAAVRAKQLRALSVRTRRGVLAGMAGMKRNRGYAGVNDLGGGGKPPKDGWVQGGRPPGEGPGKGGAIAARSLELLVENKPGLSGAPMASIEGRYRAIRGRFDAMMADLVEQFETKTGFDAPGRARLSSLVREAFGEDTGDQAAKGLAQAWAATSEHARKLFNAAGGGIGKLDGWGLPQAHDPVRLRAAGKPAWIAEILPRLAREKMVDRATGLPFSERRLAAVLSETYDTIVTGGAIDRKPGERLGTGMLANTRGEARFLVFKSADDWMAYQTQFGAGDPFGIMMHHLDEIARDTARMQILGPNPDHQFAWLAAFAEREARLEELGGAVGAREKARVHIRTANAMYDHFTGAANTPEREWLAEMGASVRAFLTGATLGSAIISDVPSSPVFGAYARIFSGLSRTGDMGALVDLIASPAARANARRSGFIIEQSTDGLVHGARDNMRLMTVGAKVDSEGFNAFARRLPSAVMRLQGLSGWTAARKRSFRLEFMGALADKAEKTLADLAGGDTEDQAFGQLLAARGFTEADWGKIRSAAAWEPSPGAKFLRPREIVDAAGEDLGLRIAEMVEMQTRLAVPETTLWTRAKLLGTEKPGTFQGEFRRSWAMFRSFTLTASYLYGEEIFLRGMKTSRPIVNIAASGAGLMGLLTLAGGISIQLRELAKGNDPRDMTTVSFWAAAGMQGGGFGVLGDFFYSSQSRAGKSSAMTGWGPAAAAVSDVYNATIGNVAEVIGGLDQGRDLGDAVGRAHIGRDAAGLLARYSPLNSLWWARAAWDRAVIANLQKLVDPDADAAFAARARRMEQDYNQGQYWAPGDVAPARAPSLAGAIGAPPP